MPEQKTLSSKVDKDLAEQIEKLSNAEDVSKSAWIRNAVKEVASESSEEMTSDDEVRAAVNRVDNKLDRTIELIAAAMREEEDSDGDSDDEEGPNTAEHVERVERDRPSPKDFAPGGERDPGPLGALKRLSED